MLFGFIHHQIRMLFWIRVYIFKIMFTLIKIVLFNFTHLLVRQQLKKKYFVLNSIYCEKCYISVLLYIYTRSTLKRTMCLHLYRFWGLVLGYFLLRSKVYIVYVKYILICLFKTCYTMSNWTLTEDKHIKRPKNSSK